MELYFEILNGQFCKNIRINCEIDSGETGSNLNYIAGVDYIIAWPCDEKSMKLSSLVRPLSDHEHKKKPAFITAMPIYTTN